MKTTLRIALCTGVLFASTLCLSRCEAWGEVSFDTDGMLLVNGERFFPVGIYELPEGDELKEIADAGFNLARASADAGSLDRAASVGLKSWIPLGGNMDVRDDAALEKLAGIVERFKDHPALLVWEGPDEPLWNVWYSTHGWMYGGQIAAFKDRIKAVREGNAASDADKLFEEYRAALGVADYGSAESAVAKLWEVLGEQPPRPTVLMSTAPERAKALADGLYAGYAAIRKTDPAHPVWLNHAPRNTIPDLAYFNRAAQIVGCDIYPVPYQTTGHSDLVNKRLSCVGDYTERMQAATPGKAVWMVLQGFGWRDLREEKPEDETQGRRPSYDETRFMAFDAIVHGADGLLYWGTHYIDKPSRFWTDLKRVVGELAGLQDVLAARTLDIDLRVELKPTLNSADRGIVAVAKRARGKTFIIAVNEFQEPLGCTLSGVPVADGARLRDTQKGSVLTVNGGEVSCFLGGCGVAVLEEQRF